MLSDWSNNPLSEKDLKTNLGFTPKQFHTAFSEWSGVEHKEFFQYLQPYYYKSLLKGKEYNLFRTPDQEKNIKIKESTIHIIPITPEEIENGGKKLTIKYSLQESLYGLILVASTEKGICYLGFIETGKDRLQYIYKNFPEAVVVHKEVPLHKKAAHIISTGEPEEIALHAQGTPFQLEVWKELLKIPKGALSTYGKIAESILTIKASRAVGTAIGSNPIAYIIPCHRVVRSTGEISGYLWGADRKKAMIGIEAVQINRIETS